MTTGTSTLLLSDFHAGHHDAHRDRKLRALEAMATFARGCDVGEVVLAGDIVDERPNRERVREECDMLFQALGHYSSVFLRGNHDEASYFDTHEMETLLRCRIDERPWHVSAVSGVVVTHGHHFRTPAIRRALREAMHATHLDELFADKRAVRHQKAMNKGFSMAGAHRQPPRRRGHSRHRTVGTTATSDAAGHAEKSRWPCAEGNALRRCARFANGSPTRSISAASAMPHGSPAP
jgi:predicted phosphodiesterase